MVVHHQLDRNRPVVLVDWDLKVEARLLRNPLDNSRSLARNSTNLCSVPIKLDLDSSLSSPNLDSSQDLPDLRAVLHLARSVKEVTDRTQGLNQARNHFLPAAVVMVDPGHSLVRNRSLLVDQVMVAKVAQHRLLDRNPLAMGMIRVRMES